MAALMVFIVFIVAIAISVPIGISMILGSAAPIFLMNIRATIPQLINNTFSGANSTPILAVPLFILGGVIMAEGGISRKLFNFFAYFVGRIPGGVPCAVVLTCLFYGAISGSGPATTAAVGAMCIPFMVNLGYDKTWAAGMISVAGGLGVIIPPSIPFVLYSLATGVSTGDLFIGGVIPGILIGVFMMIYAILYCVRKGEDRELIRQKLDELSANGFGALFLDSLPALLCPLIILGGIYTGFFTPTEAAVVSVFYAIIIALFVYRSIRLRDLPTFLASSVKTYGGLAFVLAFATAFGRVLSLTKATRVVQDFILTNFGSANAALTVCTLLFLVLGMVMDTGPAIIILAPVLLPAMQKMGVDPVHFGVVLVCCLSIGLATPPFGLDMFVAGSLSESSPMAVARKSTPFIIAFLVALVMIVYIPEISTFLPAVIAGK
ncbi:MAG: TRAP transporter large permease [Synergistaceae bacterium]|nr:TRAP transporter large permease [Synergistaceae bacterium]